MADYRQDVNDNGTRGDTENKRKRRKWTDNKVHASLEKPRPPNLVSMHFVSTSACINFLSRFYFLTLMDYSPWFEREIWPFLKVAISPKLEQPHPPKLVCMHLTSTPTCINFLSQFRSIKIFDDHGL